MKLILISGDGIGAGKTTLAKSLAGETALGRSSGMEVVSLAGAIREDLKKEFPQYDWFNRTQAYKDTVMPETGSTIRQKMVDYGQGLCEINPTHWVDRLFRQLELKVSTGVFIVDDLRKLIELDRFRQLADVCHIHISFSGSIPEPQYDAVGLRKRADYIVYRD